MAMAPGRGGYRGRRLGRLHGDGGRSRLSVEIQSDGYGTRLSESATLGATPFAPGDDAQLLGWWDAADAATITESSGAVSAWADKAPGGGAELVQTIGAAQPATGLRRLNGLNVLDFDGARFLEVGRSLPASGDVAVHMVVIVDGADNVFDSLVSVDAANDFQFDANNGAQFDGRLNVAGTGGSFALTGGPFWGAVILSLVFDRTGAGQAEVFVANVSRGVMAYTVALDASVVMRLMANRAGNTLVDGAVAEVIVTGSVANRADYHGYLATKWGLV